ncbi:YcaO-like family protein [Rhodococcus sp. IEGM 1351]|nr:YcaO-like family protein [Rhodococcus sp. IEGM 1351]MDI9940339.1 YcaO-like family protein [Rhodococcus sp. IEGM 1351]
MVGAGRTDSYTTRNAYIPPHRRHNPERTVREAQADIRDLGLRADLEVLGKDPWPTSRCILRDANENEVARGAGKGFLEDSISGAYAEALEHYWSGMHLAIPSDQTTLMRASEIADQPQLSKDQVIRRLGEEFSECMVGCCWFYPYLASGPEIAYPMFLKFPQYINAPFPGDELEYLTLSRYMCGSGTAAGLSDQEATLHGILEKIEHDALSLSLLDWFAFGGKRHCKILNRTRLPEPIANLWATAEDTIGCEIRVIDVTSDLGLPAFLALTAEECFQVGVTGAGASTDGPYAVQRALSECMQDYRLRNSMREQSLLEDSAILASLKAWPFLQSCSRLSWSELSSVAEISETYLHENKTWWNISRCEQITRKHLKQAGFESYFTPLNPSPYRVRVTTVVVPGLELFNIVRGGIPIAPTGRGLSNS